MLNDSVMLRFMEGLETPEFVLVIGVLVILSYVAVKAFPMIENLEIKKIEINSEIEKKRIENTQKREERRASEFQQEMIQDRARTEMIGKQNEIMESLVRTSDSQVIQMSALIASLEEIKASNHTLDDTIRDTNGKVSEIHSIILKDNKN